MSPAARRSLGFALALSSIAGARSPATAQWELGPSIHAANTRTNGAGFGLTVNWYRLPPVTLRGYLDAEYGMPLFKEGLGYMGPDRTLIGDTLGEPQDPRTSLWDYPNWDVHAAAYATIYLLPPWVSLGPGFAYNGHDGTSGLAGVAILHLTSIAELDFELLGARSWRVRLSVGLLWL